MTTKDWEGDEYDTVVQSNHLDPACYDSLSDFGVKHPRSISTYDVYPYSAAVSFILCLQKMTSIFSLKAFILLRFKCLIIETDLMACT
jgi:hypothetical protein